MEGRYPTTIDAIQHWKLGCWTMRAATAADEGFGVNHLGVGMERTQTVTACCGVDL